MILFNQIKKYSNSKMFSINLYKRAQFVVISLSITIQTGIDDVIGSRYFFHFIQGQKIR